MNCVLVDDEQPALDLLIRFVENTPFLDLKLATTNAIEAIEYIEKNDIDLLFLDIQMPDINGVTLVKTLIRRPLIIFTTAFDKYAVESYELDVVDYLLKPIPFDRFLKAANRALSIVESSNGDPTKVDCIWVKADYQLKKIVLDEIYYVEGLKDYVKIYTKNSLITTKLNLKNITEKLPSNLFIRVHRSYIIPLSKIDAIQKTKVFVNDKEIPVSEQYWEVLSQRLKV